MSDLQISLLGIGVLVVVGVAAFNLLQEIRYRRQAERHFKPVQGDVLLDEAEAVATDNRIEPELQTEDPVLAEAAIEPRMEAASVTGAPRLPPDVDEAIDYPVLVLPENPVSAAAITQELRGAVPFAKPVRWYGLNRLDGGWEKIAADGAEYRMLAAALQLANRSGPISPAELLEFCELVRGIANNLEAGAEFPDREQAISRARQLDSFCADVDVLIGLTVVRADGEAFPATRIRALAESCGMKLEADGAFHYRNDRGLSLFSLGNAESSPLLPDAIRQMTTSGVTFLFDVPVVEDGLNSFATMVSLARQMAGSLGALLVDDNRRPLSDEGVETIRRQLVSIYAQMNAHRIIAGGARARRLFS